MGLLEQAEATLRKWRKEHLAKPVTYYRTGEEPLEINATQAATTVDSESSNGTLVRGTVIDWIVDREDLSDLDGVPQAGDRIEITSGEITDNYEVMDLGDHCYRRHGRDHLSWRIHTKRISNAVHQ